MGRKKLQTKRIEDKSSRLVTFSKRRAGLIKKARQLSILCDADVAVVVFSASGKLYEFCSGGTNSVEHIFSRYQESCPEAKERTMKGDGENLKFFLQCPRFRTCKELLQMVDRLAEEANTELLFVSDISQLEEEVNAALMQTRSRKTQLLMEYISTLEEEGRKLSKEKEELEKQIASAKRKNGDDGGGGLNELATNQMNEPQLVTLALFNA